MMALFPIRLRCARFALALLTILCLSGCIETAPTTAALLKAVDQFKIARRDAADKSESALKESEAWRNFLDSNFAKGGKLHKTVNEILSGHISEFFNHFEEWTGKFQNDAQFTLKYVNEILLLDLEAAITVLQEFTKNPNLDAKEFGRMFQEQRGGLHLEPALNRFQPETLDLEFMDPVLVKYGVQPLKTSVVGSGYGNNHPEFNNAIDLVIDRKQGSSKSVKSWLHVAADGVLTIDKSLIDLQDLLDGEQLRLTWTTDAPAKKSNDASKGSEKRDDAPGKIVRVLRQIPIRRFKSPNVPSVETVKVVWRDDGKLLFSFPERWRFGLQPGTALAITNEGIPRELNVTDVVDFKQIVKRGDASLRFVFDGKEIKGGRRIIDLKVEATTVPRGVSHYEIEFHKVKCVTSLEDGGTDINVRIQVDGKELFPPTEKALRDGQEIPINKRSRIDGKLSIYIFDRDSIGPNDYPPEYPLERTVKDLLETKPVLSPHVNDFIFPIDGGSFKLEWSLHAIPEN